MKLKLNDKYDHYEWHDWFAWYPIIVTQSIGIGVESRTLLFLNRVKRKLIRSYEPYWEYRLIAE